MSIFSQDWDELLNLRGLGITDHAIVVYLVSVHNGKAEQMALAVLLRGRSLNADPVDLVRALLKVLYIRLMRGQSAG